MTVHEDIETGIRVSNSGYVGNSAPALLARGRGDWGGGLPGRLRKNITDATATSLPRHFSIWIDERGPAASRDIWAGRRKIDVVLAVTPVIGGPVIS